MAATIFAGVHRDSDHEGDTVSNMHLRAVLLPSFVDRISSQEVKFELRRWLPHKSDNENSIRATAALMDP